MLSKPKLKTKRANTEIVPTLLNPASPSSGVTTPESISKTITKNEVVSTGTISVTNNTMAIRIITTTMTIPNVKTNIYLNLYIIKINIQSPISMLTVYPVKGKVVIFIQKHIELKKTTIYKIIAFDISQLLFSHCHI